MATKSTAVEQRASSVPALVNTPALEIDSGDVVLPRIRIAQALTGAVGDGLVKIGDIFTSSGKDDPDPQVLYTGEGDGVLFHVVGMRKGKSLTTDGELETWAFNDPDAPADARTTYDYSVVLPEVDDEVPYKFLLSGASTAAAKLVNTLLKKNESRGPAWNLAFRVTTAQSETTKGTKTFKYHVARIRQVEANASHVEIAGDLAALIAGSAVEQTGPAGAKPAI